MSLSTILIELRKERNLSQKQVADATGISQSTIAKIEINRNEATAETIRKLSAFFEVPSDYLLELSDDLGFKAATPSGDTYTAEERKVIDDYRKLTRGMREILRTTMRAMINDTSEDKV